MTAVVLIFASWFCDTSPKSFVMGKEKKKKLWLDILLEGTGVAGAFGTGDCTWEARWWYIHSLPVFLAFLTFSAGLWKDVCVFKGTTPLTWGHPFCSCVPLICTWKNPSLCIQMPNCNANRHLCAQLPILCVCKTDVPANSAGVSW